MAANTPEYQRAYMRAYRQKRRQQCEIQGTCLFCKELSIAGTRYCQSHLDQIRVRKAAWYQEYKQVQNAREKEGLCVNCGSPSLPAKIHDETHTMCETCYLKHISKKRLGTVKHWQALQDILKKQNYLCPYTGSLLILGDNASLDHIYPVHHYPNLKDNLDNLEWVRLDINEMKRDRTPDEFIALISTILAYRGK